MDLQPDSVKSDKLLTPCLPQGVFAGSAGRQ